MPRTKNKTEPKWIRYSTGDEKIWVEDEKEDRHCLSHKDALKKFSMADTQLSIMSAVDNIKDSIIEFASSNPDVFDALFFGTDEGNLTIFAVSAGNKHSFEMTQLLVAIQRNMREHFGCSPVYLQQVPLAAITNEMEPLFVKEEAIKKESRATKA